MKQYNQTVTFTRTFSISAENAEEATSKMERMIDQSEFAGDVKCEGWYAFEDELPEETEEEGDDEENEVNPAGYGPI